VLTSVVQVFDDLYVSIDNDVDCIPWLALLADDGIRGEGTLDRCLGQFVQVLFRQAEEDGPKELLDIQLKFGAVAVHRRSYVR